MSHFYDRFFRDDVPLPEFVEYYERELAEAQGELKIKGQRITELCGRHASLKSYRFCQLQEVEAILEIVNLKLNRLTNQRTRFFMEQYDRALTMREAEKFASGDEEVYAMAMICNQIARIRNLYLGVMHGFDSLDYQLTNITKMHEKGIEDHTH